MKPKHQSLLVITVIGIINYLIWAYSGIPLSYEMPPDYSVLPHPTDNTDKELLVYFILAILLSICFYLPFLLSKKYPHWRLATGTILSIGILFGLMTYVSSLSKGLLLSNWFGDNYEFSWKMIRLFFQFPFLYFIFNKLIFTDFPKRNLVYLFLMNIAIYFVCQWINYPTSGEAVIPTIRNILVNGYFMFFYAMAFGIIGMRANKWELNKLNIKIVSDEQILDDDFIIKD